MSVKNITKRNGQVVPFDQIKITNAIWKAVRAIGGDDEGLAEKISKQVTTVLEVFFKKDNEYPNVEQIQDLVEKILIENGHAKTAKAYILYRQRQTDERKLQEEILKGRTSKLPLSINSLRVLAGRYLMRDENGEIAENPEEMYARIAGALADAEKKYGASDTEVAQYRESFYEILTNFEFTPAGRSLANIGAPTRVVANCIVLHFDDSMNSIFQTLHDAALLQQAGSGLGFAWHLLRPAGTRASATRGMASGPVSFLRAFNEAFGVIKQQGRHGANMGVMRVDHPDILEFLECKWNEGELVNFNVSVSMTDEFMQKVKSRDQSPWLCEWKGKKMKPRRVIRNKRGAVVDAVEETLTAHELMQKIIGAAWRNGEPGVLFP
ncbi:MAG: ATP cone domain-containing protein, partial [Patescibacteria group bacterium]